MTVRPATLADLDALAALFDAYRQFYREPPALDAARAFLAERLDARDSVLLVAERDGALAGFTQLYPLFSSVRMRRVWVLNDLYVAPDARRRGVARALMGAARAHAVATGAAAVQLATEHANAAGRALYESLGYAPDTAFVAYELEL